MKQPYRIAARIVIICTSLVISGFCATEMHSIWMNAGCNPGRPGFHITSFIGYMLWLPLPAVMFAGLRRRRPAGLFLLAESLYLGIHFLFWECVLPTNFIVGPGWLSIMLATALLGVLVSLYAIRTSTPPSSRSPLSTHLTIMTFLCIAMSFIFMFHWFSAGEEMRGASTWHVAGCRAAKGDFPGAIRAYDSLLKRYEHASPTVFRIDALVTRASFRHHQGDKEGVEQDWAELKELVTNDRALLERLKSWLDNRERPDSF